MTSSIIPNPNPSDEITKYLAKYEAACRALVEARSVDEIMAIRDLALQMAAAAHVAKNRDAEADALVLRMRGERALGQCMKSQKETIGLATGGDARRVARGKQNPESRPTLAAAGINKNLAKVGRRYASLSDQEFAQKEVEMREAKASVESRVVKSIPHEKKDAAEDEVEITIPQWKAMSAAERRECLKRENFPSDVKFNKQESEGIDWALNSWNPIVGCKHPCWKYCWAKDITLRFSYRYPHGFDPVLRPRMLNAPYNTSVPPEAVSDWRFKNVFTVSMGDLFGGWVPREWIEAVLAIVRANPQWTFLFLTKFPGGFLDFEFPSNVWLGTTIDLQRRVAYAETVFEKLRAKYPNMVLWYSVEPMLEPIKLNRPDLPNRMVIGGAAKGMRTPEFRPPFRWVMDLVAAADGAYCKVFQKSNLLGNRVMELPFDAPIETDYPQEAPAVFNYLKNAKSLRSE